MKALLLIKFASLGGRDAYSQLCHLKSVVDSFMVYGRYDAVLLLQGKNLEEVHDIILSEIQPVPGVIEIMPCIIVEQDHPSPINQKLQPLNR